MMVVTIRNDRGNGEGSDCVPGRKATFGEVRASIVKKSIVKGSARRNRDWAFPLRDCFESYIDDLAVNERLAREQARVHLIRIMTDITRCEEGKWNESRLGRSDCAVEAVI